MGAVAKQVHLHRRGEVYYCRIALPKSLAFIVGRSEYKKSLKTSDLRIARIKCRELSNRLEALFMVAKALRPGSRDKYIEALVRHYFERCLVEGEGELTFETITSRSPFIDEYDPQAALQTIEVSRERLAAYDKMSQQRVFGENQVRIAERLIAEGDFDLPVTDELKATLSLGVLRAQREAERIKLCHYMGDFEGGEIKDPLFKPCRNYFTNPDAEYHFRQSTGADNPHVNAIKRSVSLTEAIEEYISDKRLLERDSASEKQLKRIRRFLERLEDILGANRQIIDLTEEDGLHIEKILYSLPADFSLRFKRKGLSIEEAIQSGGKKLDIRTINSYLIAYGGFFRWCRKKRYMTVYPLQDVTLRAKDLSVEVRTPYSLDQLKALFASPIYTGRANTERMLWKPGKLKIRDGQFWLPLVGLYTGMRMGEILYLQLSDIRQSDGIWYIDVNKDEEGKELKNPQSIRQVPLHPVLIDLGFLTYVEKRKTRIVPKGMIFADGITMPDKQPITKNYSRNFSDYTVKTGIRTHKDNKQVFHSFRHNFEDAMDIAGNTNVITSRIAGHKPPKETQTTGDMVYLHNKPSLAKLHEAISKIDYGLDLSHLKPETR